MHLLIELLIFVIGLFLLLRGSDIFTEKSKKVSLAYGISETAIGSTLVAFSTSMPELAVSILATLRKHPEIILGNVIGSNFANLGLALALSVFFISTVCRISKEEVKYYFLPAIIVNPFLMILALDGGLGRLDGMILLLALFLFSRTAIVTGEESETIGSARLTPIDLIAIPISVGMVVGGAELLLRSAVDISRALGVPEYVIAFTMIAIGTSLPEIMVSVTAARKKYSGISLGNVLGSNMFNFCGILGVSALLGYIQFSEKIVFVDLPILMFYTIFVLAILRARGMSHRIKSLIMLALYLIIAYFLLFG